MPDRTKFIWMSDLHFDAAQKVEGYDTEMRLRAAIDFINAQHSDADFCIVTGDIADAGNEDSYLRAAEHLRGLGMPCVPLVGNHDRRAPFRKFLDLPGNCMDTFVQHVTRFHGGKVLCLDTLKEGRSEGELCERRLSWLMSELCAAQEETVIIAMHHPPLNLNMPVLDSMKLEQGSELLDILTAYGNVKFMLMGHVHRPVTGCVSGIPFAAMRSVTYQVPHARPAWDPSGFHPATEAPNIGVGTVSSDEIIIEYVQFCDAQEGCS